MRRLRIPQNLTSLAHRHIRNYILEGHLDAGGRLTEEYLSQQLGISKSPIREALNRLEAEGLIRIEPRRGAHLRLYSESEISDLYDFREALEAHAVLVARLTPELLQSLRHSVEVHKQHHRAEEKERYIEEDTRFHSMLAQATGNQHLVRALANLQDQLSILRRKTYDLSSSRAVPMHARIVDCLAKEDRQAAAEAMREHIRSTRDKLIEHVTQASPGSASRYGRMKA
ncbi:MAG: FCD domain-containing protein [Luteitalea sp.]|nr:FCD domain-containing protein [Luteitalea sp.]